MDYFQGVVTEYLRADRAMFVNTECLIQLDDIELPGKGRHWYCDALCVNFRESAIYLCEISYSATLQTLCARFGSWAENRTDLKAALYRDSKVPDSWTVVPWAFIPSDREAIFKKKLASKECLGGMSTAMPKPRLTHLEELVPWRYQTWNRKDVSIRDDA